ncbi:MAG: N4-gp56 family major capsid protein [Agitococcus sp.]|nr:N4-gp56 family major capsid protein [Agitococcus sp.]
MPATTIAFGDPKAQKRWSDVLSHDVNTESYFEKFTGKGMNNIIQRKTDLEAGAADRVSFDLSVRLRQAPTYGDNRVEGKEEQLRFFSDEVNIDQVRHAVSCGGQMTQQRTAHDLREVAREKLTGYFAQILDEYIFMYLSGARGVNEDFIESTAFAGFANNSLQAPDSDHILYGVVGGSKATLTSSDKMTSAVVERTVNKARMMQARNPQSANMVPVSNGASKQYVMVMSEDQAYDMRNADTNGWAKYQAAAAAAEGRNNPIFRGGLGLINDTVLHSHRNAVRFSDYGASSNLPAARALFMGRQAAVIAYGSNKTGMKYNWKEETADFGNEPKVASGFIAGIKKTRFNGKDFGVVSVDTYAKDPNA